MQVGTLDKRSIAALGLAVAVILFVRFVIYADPSPASVAAVDSIPAAEKRLAHARQIAATVPGKAELLKQAQAELVEREKGVLQADTEAAAQAQLLEMVQGIAQANNIDARGAGEFGGVGIGEDYGEIWATVQFTCKIEQFVNFLSALGAQPKILATRTIHVNGGNDSKNKTIQARVAISAIVPRKLIPKQGASTL